jgi:hypothetical protein
MQLATGAWATGIVGAAASHSLFMHLENGEDTAGKLAKRAGITERGAQTLLDGLTGLGLIELCDGAYRNTAEAGTFLVEGRPNYIGSFVKVMLAGAGDWSALPEVVRTGKAVRQNAASVASTSPRTGTLGGIQRGTIWDTSIAKIGARLAEDLPSYRAKISVAGDGVGWNVTSSKPDWASQAR